MSSKARRQGKQFTDFLVTEVFAFIKATFPFPRLVNCAAAGLKEGKKLSGEALSPGFKPWFLQVFPKISPAWQEQKSHASYARSQTFVIPWAFSSSARPIRLRSGQAFNRLGGSMNRDYLTYC